MGMVESEIVREVFSPWWKILLYMLGVALSVASIRVVFRFDVNTWLETRRKDKLRRDQQKAIEQCRHAWNLYPRSPHSVCSKCYVLISTSILQLCRTGQLPGLTIIAEDWTQTITAGGGTLTTANAIGNDD